MIMRLITSRLLPIIFLSIVVCLWELWIQISQTPSYLFPAPTGILQVVFQEKLMLVEEMIYTIVEALLGLLIGFVLAFTLGVVSSRFVLIEKTVMPIAILIKVTPIIAIAPLFAIWFGFGILPKILVVSVVTFFPILVNTVVGLRSVNPTTLLYFKSLSASEMEILWGLRLPSSVTYLFAALKVSIHLSIIGAVIAEWFGSSHGLGSLIMVSHGNLDMNTLFAAVIFLAVIGIGLTFLLGKLEHRLVRWQPQIESL